MNYFVSNKINIPIKIVGIESKLEKLGQLFKVSISFHHFYPELKMTKLEFGVLTMSL